MTPFGVLPSLILGDFALPIPPSGAPLPLVADKVSYYCTGSKCDRLFRFCQVFIQNIRKIGKMGKCKNVIGPNTTQISK